MSEVRGAGPVQTAERQVGAEFWGEGPHCPTDTGKRDTSFLQALRRSMPLILNLQSRTCLRLAPYRSATAAGAGEPFGEDKYPVTVFLALTLLTTISNNAGSLPL